MAIKSDFILFSDKSLDPNTVVGLTTDISLLFVCSEGQIKLECSSSHLIRDTNFLWLIVASLKKIFNLLEMFIAFFLVKKEFNYSP